VVLEYVDGDVIDRSCDARQVGLNDRVRLFLDVLAERVESKSAS
jgi:hypothetical protein